MVEEIETDEADDVCRGLGASLEFEINRAENLGLC